MGSLRAVGAGGEMPRSRSRRPARRSSFLDKPAGGYYRFSEDRTARLDLCASPVQAAARTEEKVRSLTTKTTGVAKPIVSPHFAFAVFRRAAARSEKDREINGFGARAAGGGPPSARTIGVFAIGAKRNGDQLIENKQSREMSRFAALKISRTYGGRPKRFHFAGRSGSFSCSPVFRVVGQAGRLPAPATRDSATARRFAVAREPPRAANLKLRLLRVP